MHSSNFVSVPVAVPVTSMNQHSRDNIRGNRDKPLGEEDNNDSVTSHAPYVKYNATSYQRRLDDSLTPLSGAASWLFQPMWAGFCNQYMMFIGIIYLSQDENLHQFIEESMQWKDTFGHEEYLPHHMLFDVVHWNTFYPSLPRFIRYEPEVHSDITVQKEFVRGKGYPKGGRVASNCTGDPFLVAENPKPIAKKQREMYSRYKKVIRNMSTNSNNNGNGIENGKSDGNNDDHIDATHRLIMNGALRPHPEIQGMIDRFLNKIVGAFNTDVDADVDADVDISVGVGVGVGADVNIRDKKDRFMVIHARVEPDMAIHGVCKVRVNLQFD